MDDYNYKKQIRNLTTPELLNEASSLLNQVNNFVNEVKNIVADELSIRAARLVELEHQASPDRNDLTDQTPLQIMKTVNSPSTN